MRVTRALPLATLALAFFAASAFAQNSPLFSLTETFAPTQFSAGTGVGQAVYVDANTTIDSFGFYLEQRGGGDVDYFILNETTGQTVLAPEAVSVAASPKQWDYLDLGTQLTLDAGDTYIFGVYGDNLMTVGMDPLASNSTTISLPASGPTSFNFTGDTQGSALTGTLNTSGLSTADVGLQISDAPEPSSLLLLGTGILAAAGLVRKRFAH